MNSIYINKMIETNIKTKVYLSPKDLLNEYNKSIDLGRPTDKLVLLFQKICKHFATTFEYKNKCDLDACINYAVSEAWLKWDKFDSEKSDNIFSFYTTMLSNDMRLHYKTITKGKATSISIDALFSNDNDK